MSTAPLAPLQPYRVLRIDDAGPPCDGGGESCQHCGNAIRYVVLIRHTGTGGEMKIGTTCAERVGLTAEQIRELNRERRRLADSAARRERAREREARRAAMFEANCAASADHRTLLTWAVGPTATADAGWIAERAHRSPLTADDFASLWAELHAALNPSRHLGTVGEKLTVVVTIVRTVLLEAYCYGAARPLLIIARTDDSDVLVTKTTAKWVRELDLAEGARHTWTGKVKAHSEYGGDAQTELTRVKATGPEEPQLAAARVRDEETRERHARVMAESYPEEGPCDCLVCDPDQDPI